MLEILSKTEAMLSIIVFNSSLQPSFNVARNSLNATAKVASSRKALIVSLFPIGAKRVHRKRQPTK